MALQIGAALRDAAAQLVSRTGAILFTAYLVLMIGIQSGVNTLLATLYARTGVEGATEMLPLVLDVPLSVAGGLVAIGTLAGTYFSLVAIRTFVADDRGSFPAGAFTRNVPLAMVNLFVGGLVYSVVVFLGTILFIVPGIIAYVAFLFMTPYIAVEDRNFVDALQASYRLSKGNWIALFGLLLLVVVGTGLFGGVAGFLGGLLLPQGLAQLAATVAQVPVLLFSLAVVAVAFRQLRGDAGDEQPPSASEESQSPATTV